MNARLSPLLLLIPLLSVAPAAAQQSRTYVSPTSGFRMEIPAAWSQVPDRALDAARAQGDPEDGIVYEAGFEAGRARWPVPPLAGIGTVALGRSFTVEEFRAELAGPTAQEEMQSGVNETGAAQVGGRVNAPRWDAENGIVWVRMALGADAKSFAWTAMKLSPDSRSAVVLIYYGAPGQDEAPVRAQMLAALQSLRAP